jgi:hypothetical protein
MLRSIEKRRIGMSLRLPPIWLALSLLLAFTATADAQDALIGFRSPSNNIGCQYYNYDRVVALRCDIMEATVTAPRPRNCDLEFGKAFEIKPKGPAERLCYGDTIMDQGLPLLPYGQVWQRGGFTCTSEQTGVTCSNTDRHGFSLSRGKQDLF